MTAALAGIRVVEFTAAMAGPWVGRIMAAAGAEVIRVESRTRPDVVRQYVSPREPDTGLQPACSPWFTDWNAGKRFVALDLHRPGGVALGVRLAAVADVVVENFAPGVMERLGLGWPVLRAAKPDLVMLSTSGLGQTGPRRGHVTWGPNLEALSGLAAASGFAHRTCAVTQYAYPDAMSALHGLVAVLAALDYRDRTGAGQHVDLSQLEATLAAAGLLVFETLATGAAPERRGNRSRETAPQGCYPCRGTDRWVAVTVAGDADWTRFLAALGDPAWGRDPRFATAGGRIAHADALDALVAAWTRERDAAEVAARLQAAGVAAGVVQTAEDLYADPQLVTRGFFETVPHLVRGAVTAHAIPLGLTATPARTGRSGAAVGEDNAWVLREVLGLDEAEIARAVAEGAVEGPA